MKTKREIVIVRKEFWFYLSNLFALDEKKKPIEHNKYNKFNTRQLNVFGFSYLCDFNAENLHKPESTIKNTTLQMVKWNE